MGELAFGKDFNLIQSEDNRFAINLLHDGMKYLGVAGTIPWLLPILEPLPGLSSTKLPTAISGWFRFKNWCAARAEDRERVRLTI